MNKLETKLGKLTLLNPVTVASGTFSLDYQDFFNLNSLGAIVTKTITRFPKEGNPPPRMIETRSGLLNSIGLQNPGVEAFMTSVMPQYEHISIPIIVSFSGSTIDEFCETLSLLEKCSEISGYEVNVSCPNVEKEGIAFGTDAKTISVLVSRLSALTDKELIIKLTPNVTDIVEIALAAKESGADSLALINTLLGMSIDWRTGKSHIKKGIAGFSGPAIKPIALQNVYRVASKVDIPILAMGGVCDWKDALEFFYAGASVVAVGTYNFADPLATVNIIEKLGFFFTENDMKLIDIIGKVTF
ncbi:MAG: dihydroorotate dehydrogenase [Candidatus Cloacimonetes bacterium]|nr:dihydroorotate dehydrogenase [Candidatus Cloacimonadota bacterium]